MKVYVTYIGPCPAFDGFGVKEFDDEVQAQNFIDGTLQKFKEQRLERDVTMFKMIKGVEIELPYKSPELNTGDMLVSCGVFG